MMPRLSGYEVCRLLRRSHTRQELPVIFLTAKHRASDLETGFASGASDYLTKPVAKRELLARVAVHLELLDAHRRLRRLFDEKTIWSEELAASNAELSRFTYTVSHDLKSPLVTINGFLGLLEKDARGGNFERMEHDLRRIRGATARMKQLLDDLLELSRIGRTGGRPEEVDLGTAACEALAMVARGVADRRAEVTIAPGLPAVTGDRVRLIQLYQNLLENAVKYLGDQPSPRIEAACRQDAEETVFFVRDNGMGIEAEYQRKVFGLFERPATRTVSEDRRGRLWLTTNQGLSRLDHLFDLSPGHLWIGTDGGGLDRFDPTTETFSHHRHDPADPASLAHDEVRSTFEDDVGALWIGTDGGGLHRLDVERGVFTRYRHRPVDRSSLSNDFVRAIYRDRSGILWIGTDGGGLNKLDRDKNAFRLYRHDPHDPDSLSHDIVFSICEDSAGALWASTGSTRSAASIPSTATGPRIPGASATTRAGRSSRTQKGRCGSAPSADSTASTCGRSAGRSLGSGRSRPSCGSSPSSRTSCWPTAPSSSRSAAG